jgi:hypothetical protein
VKAPQWSLVQIQVLGDKLCIPTVQNAAVEALQDIHRLGQDPLLLLPLRVLKHILQSIYTRVRAERFHAVALCLSSTIPLHQQYPDEFPKEMLRHFGDEVGLL